MKRFVKRPAMRYFSISATALVLLLAAQGAHAEISINPYPLGQSKGRAAKTPSDPVNIRPETAPARNPFAGATPSSQWQAFRGASAHDVLESWSQDAGVEIVWNSDEDYSIPQTVKLAGSYESAVEALLNQYGNAYGRPVGNLYVDPSSGKKTLVVSTFEGN